MENRILSFTFKVTNPEMAVLLSKTVWPLGNPYAVRRLGTGSAPLTKMIPS
jgi:hypothetical protein